MDTEGRPPDKRGGKPRQSRNPSNEANNLQGPARGGRGRPFRGRGGRVRGTRNRPGQAAEDEHHQDHQLNINATEFVPRGTPSRGRGRGRGRGQKQKTENESRGYNKGSRNTTSTKSESLPGAHSRKYKADAIEQKNRPKQAQQSDINALADGVSKLISKRSQAKRNEDQHEILVGKIKKNLLECSICLDKMKHFEKIWQCNNCYNLLHLKCAKEWGVSTMKDNDSWRCPYCQHQTSIIPNRYYCFCGREENPTPQYGEMVHSCSQPCDRPWQCEHRCPLECHPGACPPCVATSLTECSCGKTKARVKCGTNITCEEICRRKLNCTHHQCESRCHDGDCAICQEIDLLECICGGEEKEVPCGDEFDWSCGKRCPNSMDCGNHKCELVCHEDECQKCTLLPERVFTCPCGATQVPRSSRTSCLDPIPTCDGFCEKERVCGHKCPEKCHTGDCPGCKIELTVDCRCERTGDLKISCHLYFTSPLAAECQRPCKKKMSCRRHTCQTICCPDRLDQGTNSHICTRPCNRVLQCGNHRCDEVCHGTNCRRCLDVSFEELTCHCGAVVSYPPIQCGQKPPECKEICTRVHSCNHTVHHNCHSDENCPPCTVLMEKACNCGKEIRRSIPCHLKAVSCGLPCSKPLNCGHLCLNVCHQGECLECNEKCNQKCESKRPICGHICAKKCHFGEQCEPYDICDALIPLQCSCLRRKQRFYCPQLEQMKNHQIRALQKQGGSTAGEMTINIECDAECEVQERNKRIALALSIDEPELSSTPAIVYPVHVVAFAQDKPQMAIMVESNLRRLAQLCEEAAERAKFEYNLPPMNKKERMFVHELSDLYGIHSQGNPVKGYPSTGREIEPNRYITLIADRGRTTIPPNSLAKMLKIPANKYSTNWRAGPVKNIY